MQAEPQSGVNIVVLAGPIVFWLLLGLRIGVVLFATPMLGGQRIPMRVRLVLLLAITWCLVQAPVLSSSAFMHSTASALGVWHMLSMALSELFWGALMAFGLLSAFALFMVAGRILDVQMGFGLAQLVDPATRNNAPLLGLGLEWFAILSFLLADGHHEVLRVLAFSLEALPIGTSPRFDLIPNAIAVFAVHFALGLVLASSVVVVLLIIDAAMALASRLLPQANVFLLSLSLKVLVGLVVLALSIPFMSTVLRQAFSLALDWVSTLAALNQSALPGN